MRKYMSLLLVGAVLGCEGLNTGPTGDLLTEEELSAVTSQVVGVAAEGVGTAGPPAQSGAMLVSPPVSFNVDIDRTVQCTEMGAMRLDGGMAGNVDSETGEGSIELSFTQTADGCGVMTENHGFFIIDGNPNLTLEGSLQWDAQGPVGTSTFTYRGGFAWSQDDRSGTCGVDLELTWTASSASYSGVVCGQDFSVAIEVEQ